MDKVEKKTANTEIKNTEKIKKVKIIKKKK